MTPAEARAQFPVLERLAYLNAGTLGPLARGTLDAIAERLRFDQDHGRAGRAWFDDVLALRSRVRAQIADLIGTSADRVALTDSTTDGCNIVLSGLGLGPGHEVVTTDAEHPGLLLPLHVSDAQVRVAEVAARPTAAALETILSCITPRTRLLALSHVLWTTGQRMPVHELKRESGLPVLVDGAQSVGAIPIELGELDYYTVSCQKWLCGPDPLGALYVREPEALRIALPSGFAQKSIKSDGSFEPVAGAARFDSGWLTPPALAGLEAALASAPQWRYERGVEMAELCRTTLSESFDVIGERTESTLVSFVAGDGPAAISARLYEAGVVVRDLPGTAWLRASCGWWTSEDDIARLLAGLSSPAAERRG
jgi:L-cysteine/cystine lyase